MMRIFCSFGVVFFAFVGLYGMSHKFGIKAVERPHSPISFQFFESNSSSSSVGINSFFVVSRDDTGRWNYKRILWAFELAPGSAKPLTEAIYGQAPIGFHETTKATPLTAGVHYLAVGSAPGSTGSVEFVAR